MYLSLKTKKTKFFFYKYQYKKAIQKWFTAAKEKVFIAKNPVTMLLKP